MQGGRRRPLPAMAVADGEGTGVHGLEDVESYLGEASARAKVTGRGHAGEDRGRRRHSGVVGQWWPGRRASVGDGKAR